MSAHRYADLSDAALTTGQPSRLLPAGVIAALRGVKPEHRQQVAADAAKAHAESVIVVGPDGGAERSRTAGGYLAALRDVIAHRPWTWSAAAARSAP